MSGFSTPPGSGRAMHRLAVPVLLLVRTLTLGGCSRSGGTAAPPPAHPAQVPELPTQDVQAALPRVQQEIGAPPETAAQVGLPDGVVVFYRYVKDGKCGVGIVVLGVGAPPGTPATAHGERACDQLPHPTGWSGAGIAAWYGELPDARVTRVQVTLAEADSMNAQVVGGIWYVLFTGQTYLPPLKGVRFSDATGHALATQP